MAFAPGKTVDCYLAGGWKILPPTRAVCRTCGTALLWHKSYPFAYCVDCAEKIFLQEKSAPAIVEDVADNKKAPLSHEPYENDNMQRTSPALLGDLLLRGYTMSSLSCPNGCNIPLAREPSNQSTVVCASCGFQSSDAAFIEPQPQIDSKEIARQIAHKVNLIASQPGNNCQKNVEDDSSRGDAANPAGQKEPIDISIAYIAECLRDKLALLGKQLAEIPMDPLSLTTAACQQVSSLVGVMRDIQDARKMLLESLAS